MVGWHHQLIMDMSLSKLRGVGDGQGGLACCSPWGCKESDMTERLNVTGLPPHVAGKDLGTSRLKCPEKL